MKDYNDFLKSIHNSGETVLKAGTNGKKDFHKISINDIDKENKAGREIYYVVNQGGDKDNAINKFNACFIDLDAGKDDNNQYKTEFLVDIFKMDCMANLKEFVEPSFIVETRNGFHVYWLLKGETNREEWARTEKMLISKFNADKTVSNPARLLRLPYTNWMKDAANPFMVTVVEEHDVRYTLKKLQNAIDKTQKASNTNVASAYGFSDIHNKNSSICIQQKHKCVQASNINGLKVAMEPISITFATDTEAINYITHEVNMAEFLGIANPKSFNCIMHEDKNPSASIFITKNGEQMYNCFSSKCGFKGNLIAVVAQLMNCSRGKAIRFIKEALEITVEVPEHIKIQQENLKENMRMIIDGEIKEIYPDIHSVIRRYIPDLLMLHTIAQDHLGISEDENNVIFFVSQKHLASLLGTTQSNESKRTALFSLLDLCTKIDDDNVPADLFIKANSYKVKNNVRDTIQFYSIPSYTWLALRVVEEKSKSWKANGCTMMGMSREMIYRTYGEDIADSVYPKRKGKTPTDNSDKFQKRFEYILLKAVAKKGYAKESELVAKMYGWKGINAIMSKRILFETLENNNLKLVRVNKTIKEKYKIKGNGYPMIIISK